ncbi:MAG: PQQ-binding-like beta-propeller repeat protein [Limisphaerales bacterium]
MVAPASTPPAPPAKVPVVDHRLRPLFVLALVAAVFCLLTAGALFLRHGQARGANPLLSPQAAELRERLKSDPNNEALKLEIRELDLQLRQRYFRHLGFLETGTWLLLGGGLVLLAAATTARRLQERRPRPGKKPDATWAASMANRARWSVAAVGAVTGAAFLALAFTSPQSPLPTTAAEIEKAIKKLSGEPDVAEALPVPTLEEMRANWPRFLGADGNAFAPTAALPARIDFASGVGVAWKVPVPENAPGFNSPIVWSNRVYFSGGDVTNRSVYAFDTASGALVWQRAVVNVPGSPAKQPEISEMTGYACPTMATDGRRVFVLFANGDLAAFGLDGAPAWSKNLGVPHNQYGHAISLAVWQGRLIVQYDQGDADAGLSKLIAFDGLTGRVVWQQAREVPESWASPIVFEAAGKGQIVTHAGTWIIAHAATDGAELWRVEGLTGEITPSPIFAGGLVLSVSPSDRLFAIRPDGAGDVGKTHVAWTGEDGIPDVTSPVSNGELVFLVTSSGLLTCYEIKSGAKLWEHELEFDVNSTPVIAGDQMLILGTKGQGLIAAAAREFKELAQLDSDEGFLASPAVAHGRVFLRGLKHLICLGPATEATTGQ